MGKGPAALSKVRAPSPGRSCVLPPAVPHLRSGGTPRVRQMLRPSLLVALAVAVTGQFPAFRCPRGAGRALPMSPLYFQLVFYIPMPGGDPRRGTDTHKDVLLEKDNAVEMLE